MRWTRKRGDAQSLLLPSLVGSREVRGPTRSASSCSRVISVEDGGAGFADECAAGPRGRSSKGPAALVARREWRAHCSWGRVVSSAGHNFIALASILFVLGDLCLDRFLFSRHKRGQPRLSCPFGVALFPPTHLQDASIVHRSGRSIVRPLPS